MNITDNTLCVACINTLSIWNFCTEENKNIVLEEAKNRNAEDIKTYTEWVQNPEYDAEYWQKNLDRANKKDYKIIRH